MSSAATIVHFVIITNKTRLHLPQSTLILLSILCIYTYWGGGGGGGGVECLWITCSILNFATRCMVISNNRLDTLSCQSVYIDLSIIFQSISDDFYPLALDCVLPMATAHKLLRSPHCTVAVHIAPYSCLRPVGACVRLCPVNCPS